MANKRLGSKLLALLVVMAVGITYWWLWTDRAPNISIPTKMTPKPNAYDCYVEADKYILDKEKIDFALANTPISHRVGRFGPNDRTFSVAEKDTLLRCNGKALALVRQASKYQFYGPPIRSIAELQAAHANLADFTAVARLMALDSQTKACHGDWNGAVNSYIDIIRFGSDIPRGGDIIAMLVGRIVQARGRKEVWKTIDHLNADEAKAAAKRMETLTANRFTFAESMVEEKWSTASLIVEVFSKNDLPRSALKLGVANGSVPVTTKLKLGIYSKRRVIARYLGFMDDFITYAKKPYAARAHEPKMPADPINASLCENHPLFLKCSDANTWAQNGLLTTMLALQAFKMDRGTYPKDLTQLVPVYLQRLPSDPFAVSGPFRYRRTKTKYLIYSVGPDGRDDGGKWATNYPNPRHKPKPGTPEFEVHYGMVTPKSVGDVVPGISETYPP